MLPDPAKLRLLGAEEKLLRPIIHFCDSRQLRRGACRLQRLREHLEHSATGLTGRGDVIRACRVLEACGFGKLVSPLVSGRARFVWRVNPGAALVALDNDSTTIPLGDYFMPPAAHELTEAPVNRTAPSAEWRKLTFPMRPGLEIPLMLPVDMTDAEAERLGLFLRSMVQG